MEKVTPKVYLIGSTHIERAGLEQYLRETGNEAFLEILTGCDEMDIVSFYAKLCYKSLSLGQNLNVSKTRDIESNFIGCIESGHGSVLEHAMLNFVAENVSRIETTEQIRHRVGTAYSGESGRYCFTGKLKVWVPTVIADNSEAMEFFLASVQDAEDRMNKLADMILATCKDFTQKKTATSAVRRLKPLGCAETLGFSVNMRTIRHTVQMRTSRHAEEEIRIVFNQVAEIVKVRVPLLFCDAKIEDVNGIPEYVFGQDIHKK